MDVDIVHIDPEILNGTPVFLGTRVPIESLFDHLESGVTLDEFLDDFPSVSREHAIKILEMAGKLVSSKNFKSLYETSS